MTSLTDTCMLCQNHKQVARITLFDNSTFRWSLRSPYKFKPDIELRDGSTICYDCYKKIKLKKYLDVKCSICNGIYQGVFEVGSNQGHNCASYFVKQKKTIIGSYGSDYDADWIKVVDQDLLNQLDDKANICDSCITKMMASKQLTIEKSAWSVYNGTYVSDNEE